MLTVARHSFLSDLTLPNYTMLDSKVSEAEDMASEAAHIAAPVEHALTEHEREKVSDLVS